MKRFIVILIFFILIIPASGQEKERDSLQHLLRTTPDINKIDIYQSIVTRLWLNQPDSAMLFATEAFGLAKKINDIRSRAIASRLLGGVYYYKGSYDSTIKYSFDAFTLSQAVGDSTLMTSAMNNIGLAYYNMASFPEALEYLLRALQLKTKIKQDYGYSQTLNNIGLVYTELKQYNKARNYFSEAKRLAGIKGDRHQQLYSMNNIGFTFIEENQFDTAKVIFENALEFAKTLDNTNWHAVTYSGLGQVYFKFGDLPKARSLFKHALTLRKKISDQTGIAETYSHFAQICSKEGNRDSAHYYLRKSQLIAKQIRDKDQMITNYSEFKKLFVQEKRFDSALYYQTQYIALRDSVYNENLARNIQGIQLEVQKAEAETKLAAKDDEIRKITAQTYALIAFFIILLVVSIFLYKSNKEQKRLAADLVKTNREITLQKEEIHQQRDKLALGHAELEMAKEVITRKNEELSKLNWQLQNTVDKRTRQLQQANYELEVVNLELDNFIYRSSHDIRGPLVRLLGICHVAMLDVKDEKSLEYLNMLFEAATQLNEIFDRLKVVSHINEAEIRRVKINFDELLTQVLDRLKTMDGFHEVEIVRDTQVNEWNSDPFLLELVMLNMIENAIRFQKKSTSEKKFVRVRTMKNGKAIKMAIIDNGIGINESASETLYQMFSRAARNHKNIGLGLYIVKQSLNKLNGSITLVKNDSGFTEFEIVHPLLN
jgi:signal transduction histidine kinase